MQKRTPYNILNLSANKTDEVIDEEVFKKFVKMIEWIEDEKLKQIRYDFKDQNNNYQKRKDEYLQAQEKGLKLIQMQEECIQAYRKIATKSKREEYENERKSENEFRKKYQVKSENGNSPLNIDAYKILELEDKEDSIIRKEDIKDYDDQIELQYTSFINNSENATYKDIQDLDAILVEQVNIEQTKIVELEKVINQLISRLEKDINREREVITAYSLIANQKRRINYNLEKNTYEVDLGLTNDNIKIERYNSQNLELSQGKHYVVRLYPTAKILYQRGADKNDSKLIEYLIKGYERKEDKNGEEFLSFLGKNVIYTENDLSIMISLFPEIKTYVTKYLLSPENIEKSKKNGHYVGNIFVKDNNFEIVKEKSAEKVAKMVQIRKQEEKNKSENEEIKGE